MIKIIVIILITVVVILIIAAFLSIRAWYYNPHRVIPIIAKAKLGKTISYNHPALKKRFRQKGIIMTYECRIPKHADRQWLKYSSKSAITYFARNEDGSINKFNNNFYDISAKMLLTERTIETVVPKPQLYPEYY